MSETPQQVDKDPTAVSPRLAHFVAALAYEDIPADVLALVKTHILDTVGIGIGNATLTEIAAVDRMVHDIGSRRESTLWGTRGASAAASLAALANGARVHASDFDDTHAQGAVHPSAVVVPGLLAIAETLRVGGREFLTAATAGYEVVSRLGAAAPHRFTARGLHATPICGTVGMAPSAARLFGDRSVEAGVAAIGTATSFASGLLQPLREASPVKFLHAGWAAHCGVMAGKLGYLRFPAPHAALEGDQGLYESFLSPEEYNTTMLTEGLAEKWQIRDLICKPYPTCNFTHAFIDGALQYRATRTWRDVTNVICEVPPSAVDVVCRPNDEKRNPQTPYQAKFSLPFCVAVALIKGEVTESSLTQSLTDGEAFELSRHVDFSPSPRQEYSRSYGGALHFRECAGENYHISIPSPKGSAAAPLSTTEIKAKFNANTDCALNRQRQKSLMRFLETLDEQSSLAALKDLM